MVLLIVLRVIAMTCRIMLTVVLLYARQNVCVLYYKLLTLGVVVGVALLIWPEVWFYGIQIFIYKRESILSYSAWEPIQNQRR